jgi:hypothetical protein
MWRVRAGPPAPPPRVVSEYPFPRRRSENVSSLPASLPVGQGSRRCTSRAYEAPANSMNLVKFPSERSSRLATVTM